MKEKTLKEILKEMKGNPVAHFWDTYDLNEVKYSKTFERHNLIVCNRKALEETVKKFLTPRDNIK